MTHLGPDTQSIPLEVKVAPNILKQLSDRFWGIAKWYGIIMDPDFFVILGLEAK